VIQCSGSVCVKDADCYPGNYLQTLRVGTAFYRATLCVSAVFAVARCPSVRSSVTFVHSIEMAKDIVKLLCRPGSPIILVFDLGRRYPIPRGTPSAGAQNTRGWGNFAIFD